MSQNETVEIQSIAQGRCTECGNYSDNFSVEQRVFDLEWGIERSLKCECGSRSRVTTTDEGIIAEGSITHEDASWT
jgi:hypothetical protein